MQRPDELLKAKTVALRGALAVPDAALAQDVAMRWALGARDFDLRNDVLRPFEVQCRLLALEGK